MLEVSPGHAVEQLLLLFTRAPWGGGVLLQKHVLPDSSPAYKYKWVLHFFMQYFGEFSLVGPKLTGSS